MHIDKEKYSVLIQATRYLHAMHDIELEIEEKNFIVKLKALTLTLNDPTLKGYWDEFLRQLNIKKQDTA
ncbi:MAG: hypothetical protein ACRBHB_03020 [Arenicella sp.]